MKAIFGMNFFDFSAGSGNGPEKFTTSKDIWIFWLTAAGLTAVTFCGWLFWQSQKAREWWRNLRKREDRVDPEKFS